MLMVSLTSKQYRHTNLDGVARAWQSRGGTLTDLAVELGMSPSYLSQLLSGKRAIGDRTARKLEARLGWDAGTMDAIHPQYLPFDPDVKGVAEPRAIYAIASTETAPGYVRVPQLGLPAGAGPGAEIVDGEPEIVRWLDVSEQWAAEHFPRNRASINVLTVRGDSMVGAGIMNGDLLFVDTSVHRYDGDGYYVLQFRDGWQVKRLRADVLSQQLEIVSMLAAREESRIVLPNQEGELTIAGRVAAWWTLRKH